MGQLRGKDINSFDLIRRGGPRSTNWRANSEEVRKELKVEQTPNGVSSTQQRFYYLICILIDANICHDQHKYSIVLHRVVLGANYNYPKETWEDGQGKGHRYYY